MFSGDRKGFYLAACISVILALCSTLVGCSRGAKGGLSWVQVRGPLDKQEIISLCFSVKEGILYAGTNGEGVWGYREGEWQRVGEGFQGFPVFSLLWDEGNSTLYAAAGERGVWKFDGEAWEDTGCPQAVYLLALDAGRGVLFAGTNRGVWAFSEEEWKPTEGLSGERVRSLCWEEGRGWLFAGTDHGLWLYTGVFWLPVGGRLRDRPVISLAYDRCKDVLFVGTEKEALWAYREGTWELIPEGPQDNPINSLACDAELGILVAGTEYGVWVFDGERWINTGGEIKEFVTTAVAIDRWANKIFAGVLEDAGVWEAGLGELYCLGNAEEESGHGR
jgi:hypothetical protein